MQPLASQLTGSCALANKDTLAKDSDAGIAKKNPLKFIILKDSFLVIILALYHWKKLIEQM